MTAPLHTTIRLTRAECDANRKAIFLAATHAGGFFVAAEFHALDRIIAKIDRAHERHTPDLHPMTGASS